MELGWEGEHIAAHKMSKKGRWTRQLPFTVNIRKVGSVICIPDTVLVVKETERAPESRTSYTDQT